MMTSDGNAVEIRLAEPADIGAIAAVLRDAFAEFAPSYTPVALAATTPNAAALRDRWAEGPVWVAVESGRVVGTVAAQTRGDATYLRSMAISPGMRGRGTGRRLLEAVHWHGKSLGHRRVFLRTTPFLHGAIRLYQQFGFRFTDERGDLHGTPLRTMELELR